MEVKITPSDREFPDPHGLMSLSTDELRKLVIAGTNNHLPTSKTSAAKRVLDDRLQQEQIQANQRIEAANARIETTIKAIDEKNSWRETWSFLMLIATTIMSAVGVYLAYLALNR